MFSRGRDLAGRRSRLPSCSRIASRHRRPRLEPLEDRRLLSITVDTLIDENNGVGVGAGTSLREAIAAVASGDTINFSVTGTINLTSLGQLAINKSLTINGPGADLLIIRAHDPTPDTRNGDGSRVFNIDNSFVGKVNVMLSGITVTGGDVTGGGGGIRNLENLTITDAAIRDNATTSDGSFTAHGGGIYSRDGTLTIARSSITGNSSAIHGGGIYNLLGQMTVSQSTISNNRNRRYLAASGRGGGIYNGDAVATISNSVISSNTVEGSNSGEGGGIFARKRRLIVNTSSVSNNSAFTGGGIDYGLGRFDVIASTVSGNSANSAGGINFVGGGQVMEMHSSTISGNRTNFRGAAISISGSLGSSVVRHSTIHDNKANINNSFNNTDGGGILVQSGTAGRIVLQNSIVAGNTAGGPINSPVVNKSDITGPVDAFYTLIGVNTGAQVTSRGGNKIGTSASPINPLLGPLATNGGPTSTHALLSGSPAINAGDPAAAAGIGTAPLYDQRGMPYYRVIGSRLDMGAFEYQSPAGPILPGDYNRSANVDAADYVVWRKLLGQTVPAFNTADGNGNGSVGSEDLGVWTRHFSQPTGPTLPGDYNDSENVDAADYVVWRKFEWQLLPPFDSPDGSGNGFVGLEDYSVWFQHFGQSIPPGNSTSPADEVAFASETNTSLRDDAFLAWLTSQSMPNTYDRDELDDGDGSQSDQIRRPLADETHATLEVSLYDGLGSSSHAEQ